MMADFQHAVAPVMVVESRYSNSATDTGGETKYGISKKQYPNVDIKNLGKTEAMAILKRDYWDKYHFSEIQNQDIANNLFLITINAGPDDGARVAQNALNACGVKIKVDGNFGPVTIHALNAFPLPKYLVMAITLEECRYYLGLVDKYPKQKPNFIGWIRRALTI